MFLIVKSLKTPYFRYLVQWNFSYSSLFPIVQWSGGVARTGDNETFPTLNQSMICTYQVNGPTQSQKWSVLPTPPPNHQAINEWCSVWGYHIVTMSLIYNVSCFQFASHAAASISQTVSCYPLALTPLPHAPGATLMMHCTLDNVKCIWSYSHVCNALSGYWQLVQ